MRAEVAEKGLAYKTGVVKSVLSSRRQQPTILGFPLSNTLYYSFKFNHRLRRITSYQARICVQDPVVMIPKFR